MSARKIVITHEVRALLVELNELCQRFDDFTATLSDRTIENSKAMDVGAEREHIRGLIQNCAYRINMEATGRAKKEREKRERERYY